MKEGRILESEATDDYGLEESGESNLPGKNGIIDEQRVQSLLNFGYPEDYVRFCLSETESCYCMATYYLLGEDQRY